MTEALTALLSRVEAAEGQDEAELLASEILDALGFERYEMTCPNFDMWGDPIISRGWNGIAKPNIATSLDAALALVEKMLGEDTSWSVAKPGRDNGKHMNEAGGYILHPNIMSHYNNRGFAKTPALALLAALLKAVIADGRTRDQSAASVAPESSQLKNKNHKDGKGK